MSEPMNRPMPPQGAPVPPQGVPMPPQGAPVPPQGAPVPPQGAPVPPYAYTQAAYAGQAPAAPPQPPRPPRLRVPADKKDRVFAVLWFLFSVLWVDLALMHGFRLGFTVAAVVNFVLLSVYLVGKGAAPRPYPLVCGLCAVAGSIPFALYADVTVQLLSFFGTLALFILYGGLTTHSFQHDAGDFWCMGDIFSSLLIYPFQYMGATCRSVFAKRAADSQAEKGEKKRVIGKVLIGLLCALPVLAIVIPLMMRADVFFEQLLSHLSIRFDRLLWRVIVGAMLFPLLFTVIFAWKKRLPVTANTPAGTGFKGIDPIGIHAFLGALSAVYVVYLLSQLAYFFSAFRGLLPEGYDLGVTEYARRGFFEMCAIAAINLLVVFLAMMLVRKNEGRLPRGSQLLGTFLCLFTLLLIGTALAKMLLYIDFAGMTRLRILTSCFMVLLVLVFLAVMIRLWVSRFPYMKVVVLSACLIGLTVSFADVDSVVCNYNLNAYRTGMLSKIDVEDMARLSDSAVPTLVELMDDSDPDVAEQARGALRQRLYRYYYVDFSVRRSVKPLEEQGDWREYNLAHQTAMDLLRENAGRILN